MLQIPHPWLGRRQEHAEKEKNNPRLSLRWRGRLDIAEGGLAVALGLLLFCCLELSCSFNCARQESTKEW